MNRVACAATKPLFALLDPQSGAGADGELAGGPWSVATSDEESVQFAAPGAGDDVTASLPIVWRVELTTTTAAAGIAQESTRVTAVESRLATVDGRVRGVLARGARRDGDSEGDVERVSFGVDAHGPELGAADRDLLGYLHGAADGSVSFAAGEEGESPSKIEALLASLWRRATALACVETVIGGRAVAATRVGLLGDLSTQLLPGASSDEARVHQQTLAATLRTRRAWARIVLSTLQTALLIGSGNLLLALPAAWKFVRGVMAEVAELEAAQPAV